MQMLFIRDESTGREETRAKILEGCEASERRICEAQVAARRLLLRTKAIQARVDWSWNVIAH